MMRNNRQRGSILTALVMIASVAAAADRARAVLYLYEPFNYTSGDSLGGSGGVPVGQTGSFTQDFGSGTSYTWYARATGGPTTHDPAKDALVSSGSLSYAGLAFSQGNSVSYGSALPNAVTVGGAIIPENDTFNRALYADTVNLPVEVNSGSLYASFIVRIKSEVENGAASADRHAPVGFVREPAIPTSGPNAGVPGTAIPTVQSGTATPMAGFWMRRDPDDAGLGTSNFGAGKSSGDGIGPGPGPTGPSVGWQRSIEGTSVESNQFGDLNGQPEAVFADSNSWQTYFVVLKYEFNAETNNTNEFDPPGIDIDAPQFDTVSLWMNPGSGTLGVANGEALASQNPSGNLGSYYAATDAYGGATSDISTPANPNSLKSFSLLGRRQNTNETLALDIDELRIGTTWADVTPTTAPGLAGDFNGDGRVDSADYVVFRKTGQGNYTDFVENFGEPSPGSGGGAVPEPSTFAILALFVSSTWLAHRANRRVPLLTR